MVSESLHSSSRTLRLVLTDMVGVTFLILTRTLLIGRSETFDSTIDGTLESLVEPGFSLKEFTKGDKVRHTSL